MAMADTISSQLQELEVSRPETRANASGSSNTNAYRVHRVDGVRFCLKQNYIRLEPVGQGSYGCVAKAYDLLLGKTVAIKKSINLFENEIDTKRTLREVKILRHLGEHENVVKLLDIMTDPPNSDDFHSLYLVLDYYESDLLSIIRSQQRLTERHYKCFISQILKALKYMHSAKVIHRDLKPGNVLLNADCQLGLCDFGLSRGVDDEMGDLTEDVVTLWYRAPEIMCSGGQYDEKVDLWSVGCTLGELVWGKPLFPGSTVAKQLRLIVSALGIPDEADLKETCGESAIRLIQNTKLKQPPQWIKYIREHCSAELSDLLYKLLQFNPKRRISVHEALEHPFIRSHTKGKSGSTCPQQLEFGFEREYPNAIPKEVVQSIIRKEVEGMDAIQSPTVRPRHE